MIKLSNKMSPIPLKFLFFPRATTIWDLDEILDKSSILRNGEIDVKYIDQLSSEDVIVLLFKKVIGEKEGKRKVDVDGVERFFKLTEGVVKNLIQAGLKWEAKIYYYRSLNMLTYLLSCYCVWESNTENELKIYFGSGEMSEKAFENLMKSITEGFWLKMAELVDAKDVLYLILYSYLFSLETLLERLNGEKKDKILEKLKALKNFYKAINHSDVIKSIFSKVKEDNLLKKIITVFSSALLETSFYIRKGRILSDADIDEIRSHILDNLGSLSSIEVDAGRVSLEETLYKFTYEVMKKVIDGDIDEAVKHFRELGKKIIEWKLTKFGSLEILPIQLPPEMISLTVPRSRKFDFDLLDYFDPSSLITLTNDILSYITSWGREIRSLFRFTVFNSLENVKSFLSKAMKDPYSNTALLYTVGLPEVLYIDIADSLLVNDKLAEKYENLINDLLIASYEILKEKTRKIQELLERSEGIEVEINKVVGFYSYRTLYLLSPRLYSPQIKEKLERLKTGAKIYELVEVISKINESIFGKPVEKRDVSDLFT